ncbi:MAG TPA: phosphotransferase [Candidatus Limnocylindria bacterium]|jgi:hypothetical protein|nr:phosphotransferase [Candidatus Limnocylindria bacterium]
MLELITTPVDRGNPALAALFDQEELAKELDLFTQAHWKSDSPQEFRARVLRWHTGNRCTLEIARKNGGMSPDLIGKIYAVERPDIYEYLGELERAGFDRTSKFSTPQALAYVPSLRLLLVEKVQGLAVREVFLGTDPHLQVEAARRSALWLARFQDVGPRRGPVTSLQAQFAQLERWAGRLAPLGGPLAEKSKELFRRLKAELPKLGGTEDLAGHGSYSPDHVLLTNSQTMTIDWDGYDVADPARDVARFVVATERLALGHLHSICALNWLADLFLETYVGERGTEILPRLPFYRAAMCLKLAKYCAMKAQVPQWEKKVAAMLDEGIQVLRN